MNFMTDNAYQFVDTLVLVYAHDMSSGIKHVKSRELIQSLWESKAGCLSVQVLQEFYVTVTQKVTNPIKGGEVARIFRDLA